MDIKMPNQEPEAADPKSHPSPTMKVHFANGVVVPMNRKERRRRGLYGDRLIRKRR